jgi:tryptophanase
VLELYGPEALNTVSAVPFKGNMDLDRLRAAIEEAGTANVSFVRMEATTNLIGGQPFSMENLRQVKALIEPMGIFLVVDGSLISENAYFIHQREAGYENKSITEIVREIMNIADLGAEELQRSRRADRHQPQGSVRSHPALATVV